jgi:hypothetical protein
MHNITSILLDGRAYNSVTLEAGDSLEAVCLFFNFANWQGIYQLTVNDLFRQTHQPDQQGSFDFSDEPILYIPAQSGTSGHTAVARLDPIETFCRQIAVLERTETNSVRLTTYIRKMFDSYDSSGWDAIIPRARDIDIPASMRGTASPLSTESASANSLAVQYIAEHQELPVDGRMVDIGHFFTGLDAKNHLERPILLGPTMRQIRGIIERARRRIGDFPGMDEIQRRLGRYLNIRDDESIPILSMTDNQRVATWAADLGSVAVEFIHASMGHRNFNEYYNNYASMGDMRGNIDSYAFPFDRNQSLSSQFRSYYISPSSQRRQRFSQFRQIIGMRNDDSWKNDVTRDVLNSALGYAHASGRSMDVALIIANRMFQGRPRDIINRLLSSSSLPQSDYWEIIYRTVCRATVDKFVNDTMSATF